MNKKFALGLVKNEVEIILDVVKVRYSANILDNDLLSLSFNNKRKRDKAYDGLRTRFYNNRMFGYTSSITKDFDKLIYISLK